jgi:hypothetical protein
VFQKLHYAFKGEKIKVLLDTKPKYFGIKDIFVFLLFKKYIKKTLLPSTTS